MMQATPYQSFPNTFKRDLLAGKRLIGCWSSLANAITTEVLGVAGFDWILLDGEHSPNDIATFIPQLMALKDSPSAPVVRPSSNNEVELKRLLDAGHEYTTSTIYSTIQRNGRNNPTIAAALLDAIEAEQATRRSIDDRRAQLAAA